MKEKIVYLEQSGIGNLILATPMLKAIRELKPKAEILALAWNRSIRALEGLDFIDNVLSIESNNIINNFTPRINHLLISPVGAVKEVADILYNISDNVITTPIGAVWAKHEIEYKMSLAKKLGYKGPTPKTSFGIFDYNRSNADKIIAERNIGEKFICINASYLKHDHWPLKHIGNYTYAGLIEKINAEIGLSCVLLGSYDDIDNANNILNKTSGNFNLCGISEDIKDTAAIIEKSKMIVGNDGGLMHIAAALEIPTVTVFTFTNPIKNRPIGRLDKLVMKPCDKRISCQHGKWQQCDERGCTHISYEKIFATIQEILPKTN